MTSVTSGPGLVPPDPMTIAPRAVLRPSVPRLAQDAAGWAHHNKFLDGPFTPWTEETEAYDLEVDGEIPADLAGALFRVSSNPRFQPRDPGRYHWWEGDGMVCGIYLREGRAAFRTGWVMTDSEVRGRAGQGRLQRIRQRRHPRSAPPGRSPREERGEHQRRCLRWTPARLLRGRSAVGDAPRDLETYGTRDFHGGIDVLCTAHYKIDPDSGDMLFFSATGPVVTWYRADVKTGQSWKATASTSKCPC